MNEPLSCASQLSGRLLLLVEDDPVQLEGYRRMLERLGCAVFAASTAEEGIAFARSVTIDAILTDNVLAGMTGLRSISEYAKSTDAPVVIMTGHACADLEKDARLLGAKGVFVKPLVPETILAGLVEKMTPSVPGRPR